MFLDGMLKPFIRVGSLKLIDSSNKLHIYQGDPIHSINVTKPSNSDSFIAEDNSSLEVIIRLKTKQIERQLLWQPELALGEGYMKGSLVLEKGTIYDLLNLATRNLSLCQEMPGWRRKWFSTFVRLCSYLQQYTPIPKAQQNVSHHYDMNDEFATLFLDEDRQYSCAYFKNDDEPLETAQFNKKQHIAQKMLLQAGQRVLDIGCGWGGLAIYLAKHWNVEVVGLTLSKEQHKIAVERAKNANLSHRVKFLLRDYREETEQFDRIVSVGMFEHVGVPQYPIFFEQVSKLLKEDGVMLLHSIGSSGPPRITNAWIRKYIFPGGYCPSLSEVIPKIENSKLHITDIEILRFHYAETLKAWRERFMNAKEKASKLYNLEFCRMWEFYLASCEAAFRNQELMVFQLQLARNKKIVPITRDYMYKS